MDVLTGWATEFLQHGTELPAWDDAWREGHRLDALRKFYDSVEEDVFDVDHMDVDSMEEVRTWIASGLSARMSARASQGTSDAPPLLNEENKP